MLKTNPTLSFKKFIIPSLLVFSPSFSLAVSTPTSAFSWEDKPDEDLLSATDWSLLVSADTFLIACVLAWVLYTYCFPHKVWGLWQKLFAFDSLSEELTVEKK